MKRIDAVVRRERFGSVKKALEGIPCPGMMVSMIRGYGRQRGKWEESRGRRFKVQFLPKVLITIFAGDEQVPSIVKAIQKSALTGEVGDGKIFISNLENAVRVRTAEEGDAALT